MDAPLISPAAAAGQAEPCRRAVVEAPQQLALCQCCLRETRWANYSEATAEASRCECGGEVCPCEFCLSVLELLKSGERSKEALFTARDVGEWTPEGGLVAAPAAGAVS